MAGAQVNQGLPGVYHQQHDRSVTSTVLTGQPLTSTNIQLPAPTSHVPQTHVHQRTPISHGSGITAQPPGPQAPDSKRPHPTYPDLDPASIALQLRAYNDRILAKKGLLFLRERLEAQKQVCGDAFPVRNTQLPSQEHRNLALRDVQTRFDSRINQTEPADTIRQCIKLKIIKTECWIEWGEEMHVDYSFHTTRLQALTMILNLLGSEPDMPSCAPSHADGHQPAPQVPRSAPLGIEVMDLSRINITENRAECHWCRAEQPWGIPGGIHLKPSEEHDASAIGPADATDDDDADYVSTMCRACVAHRHAIGTHARHGPFKDHPRHTSVDADAYFAPARKSYMRQTSCAVCSGLAVAVCAGCPLRVCVNCQVVLVRLCAGDLGRLLDMYGEEGRRNDARLMTAGLRMDLGREREEGAGTGEGGEEEDDDSDELIDGEFGRTWRDLRIRDRAYRRWEVRRLDGAVLG